MNKLKSSIKYIVLNYIVAYIPFWTVRKLLYRLFGLKIGKGSRIAMRCILLDPKKISIGDRTIINEFSLLDGRGTLIIGNDNSISMFSKIYSATHLSNSNDFEYVTRKTQIKDNCWLGASSVILPGSILNDFTIIGANSVFKGISEDKCIYQGVPAIKTKNRVIDKKYQLNNIKYFR